MQVSELFMGDCQSLAVLNKSKLWQLDTSKLTTINLISFIKQAAIDGFEYEARQDVLILLERMLDKMVAGTIPYNPIVTYDPAQPRRQPRLLGEYCTDLIELSIPRRRAILFALETDLDLSLDDVVELSWRAAAEAATTEASRRIVMGLPRHLRLPYAFWEWMDHARAMPLVGLQASFEGISGGRSFPEYKAGYKGALRVMPEADAELVALQCGLQL
ncbi:hypothetical protein [Chromobacterium sp. ASV23]|uniref:hypothetical protein n=1 Tax=Chromobacterium sp. ASV23 TaxID=2795110 RepID=UPI0018ED7CD8|nr:hypothetical protein [Chromobacterium sp. ASV23]